MAIFPPKNRSKQKILCEIKNNNKLIVIILFGIICIAIINYHQNLKFENIKKEVHNNIINNNYYLNV